MSSPGRADEKSSSAKNEKYSKQQLTDELKRRECYEEGMTIEEMRNLLTTLVESEIKSGSAARENLEKSPTPEPVLHLRNRELYTDILKSRSTPEEQSKILESSSVQMNRTKSEEKDANSGEDFVPLSTNENAFFQEFDDSPKFMRNRGGHSTSFNNTYKNSRKGKRGKQKQNAQDRPGNNRNVKTMNLRDIFGNCEDVPLESERSCVDQSGVGCAVGSFKDNENVIARLSQHLRRVAEISHDQRRSSDDFVFQWGNAIKIGSKCRIFDKKNPDDEESDPIDDTRKSEEALTETTHGQKSLANKLAVYDYTDGNNENGDNSDDDFQPGSKRKKSKISSVGNKVAKIRRKESFGTVEEIKPEENESIGKKADDSAICIDVSDDYTITDDDSSEQPPPKKLQSESAEPELFFPRRIVPPKPGSKCPAKRTLFGSSCPSRAKKETNEAPATILHFVNKSKSRSSLQDEEIAEVLGQNDKVEDSDTGNRENTESVDIRPMRISGRMKLQSERLAMIQQKEKEKEKMREEAERIREKIVSSKKEEHIRQRIKEEKERLRLQEEADKRKTKRDEDWKALVAQGDRKRVVERTELHPDGRPRYNKSSNDVQENNVIVNDSDDEITSHNSRGRDSESGRVRCPICNRCFTAEEIEAHAGACEEYDACPPGISRSSSPSLTPTKGIRSYQRGGSSKLECLVCDNFSTYNGIQYEAHVYECLRRKKYEEPRVSNSVIEVPTSPLRTVKTISEQTDSEINYKSQFKIEPKSNKNFGKKRKRQ